MTITELKAKYSERIINQTVTDVVVAGISRIAAQDGDYTTPLASEIRRCFDDINASKWDDIRSIVKRSL